MKIYHIVSLPKPRPWDRRICCHAFFRARKVIGLRMQCRASKPRETEDCGIIEMLLALLHKSESTPGSVFCFELLVLLRPLMRSPSSLSALRARKYMLATLSASHKNWQTFAPEHCKHASQIALRGYAARAAGFAFPSFPPSIDAKQFKRLLEHSGGIVDDSKDDSVLWGPLTTIPQ